MAHILQVALVRLFRIDCSATNPHIIQLNTKYYNDKIAVCKGDIKGSWRSISEVMNKKPKSTNSDCIKKCGQEISRNSEIANVMNEYFAP